MKKKLEITSGAYLTAAAGVTLLPPDVFTAVFSAAAVHELFHLLILRLLCVPVYRITLDWAGVKIRCGAMTPGDEFLCSCAGPVGSLSLLTLGSVFPMVALFGLIQGIFNLIPIYPLDGGRMVSAAVSGLFPNSGKYLTPLISLLFLLLYILICMRLSSK